MSQPYAARVSTRHTTEAALPSRPLVFSFVGVVQARSAWRLWHRDRRLGATILAIGAAYWAHEALCEIKAPVGGAPRFPTRTGAGRGGW